MVFRNYVNHIILIWKRFWKLIDGKILWFIYFVFFFAIANIWSFKIVIKGMFSFFFFLFGVENIWSLTIWSLTKLSFFLSPILYVYTIIYLTSLHRYLYLKVMNVLQQDCQFGFPKKRYNISVYIIILKVFHFIF